ncbi:unnamed protein product [Owenia fusiformis]|uniref:phosphatidylinositol-3,5-bisphosphate 3-phosphatase n=1 Tax=Owenia fusiformis TaxID=6347 RepID=A0A8J1THK3_OWEFU|nr:unnamed protein product [Owenia fusiformis]
MEYIRTPKVENVRLIDRFNSKKSSNGTLYLTATHLIFVDPQGKQETWILHMHVASVEKLALTTSGSPLQIKCKTFLNVTFIIPRERDCHDIYCSLMKLAKPANFEDLYAFQYTATSDIEKQYGWDMYSIENEFCRMGLPNDNWILTNINKDYEICDTYSSKLYVPKCASTPVLVGSSKFRSRGRLPALSYLYSNQAAICRCSQPLSGFSARCVEDEQMLQSILRANPNSPYMYVVDTRPKINAMANKAAGKGYENESNYTNIKFHFLGIENIHVMRSSLTKMLEVCELRNPSETAFLKGLEDCKWLNHIRNVLCTSVFISKAVQDGVSVLVHCSDGWDRTAQTCSIAGILLDPYYRTIQGFQALIEKEWLSFGHKFIDRCGFLEHVEVKETSPIFTQFIDCVWQLSRQFPCAFQFNERFLLTIHDHVYSCQYGTFIGNCEKDRVDLRLSERTYSLWGHLSSNMTDYINPFFKQEYELSHPVLRPNTAACSFQFWRGMYNRFDIGVHPRENIADIISAMKDHTDSMEDHVALLEKRVKSMCKLLGKSDETVQRKLQGMVVSSESLFSISDLTDLAHKFTSGNHLENDGDLSPNEGAINNGVKHSDSESGFEDEGSLMSKSGVDDSPTAPPRSLSMLEDNDNLAVDTLLMELHSIAVDWRQLRNVTQCSCAAPFEHFTKKYHCWKCGNVFCTRCIDRHIPLPGHYSQRPVPVCRPCYKEIKHSPSTPDFRAVIAGLPLLAVPSIEATQ